MTTLRELADKQTKDFWGQELKQKVDQAVNAKGFTGNDYSTLCSILEVVYRNSTFNKEKCPICGEKVLTDEFVEHHIVPINIGGSNHDGNKMLVCRSCHQAIHRSYGVNAQSNMLQIDGNFFVDCIAAVKQNKKG